jgi:hypothetical protein
MTTTDPSMGPDRRPASAADTLNSIAAGLAAPGFERSVAASGF